MEILSKFFKKKDGSGWIYTANFTLLKTELDYHLYGMVDDIKAKVKKRLEDHLFEQLKDKIVADDVLTQKVVNEIRLLVAKRIVEKETAPTT